LILTNSDDWAGAKLDVDGNIKIRGGGPGAGKVLTSDADGLATWEDAAGGGGDDVGKFVDGSDDAAEAVYTDGNVGIGTTDPAEQLHVSNGDVTKGARLENREYDNGNDTILGALEFASQDGNVEAQTLNPVRARVNGVQQNASVGAALHFYTANSLEVEPSVRMRIIADGAVHIGSDADWPTAKLDVSGNVRIRGGGPGAGKVLTSDADGLATWEDAAGGGGKFVDGSDDAAEAVYTDGNVGIGTTDPAEQLHVSNGDVTKGATLRLHNTAYNTGIGANTDAPLGTIEFGSENANIGNYNLGNVRASISGVQQNASAAGAIVFKTANSMEADLAKRIRIMADGNLILTNSDDWAGAKLDVDGNIKIRGGGPGAGKVLTSDADGLATWEDAPAGGGGGGGKFVDGADSPTDAVYLDGDVGIGAWNPAAKLHVSSSNKEDFENGAILRLENREYDVHSEMVLGSVEFASGDGNIEASSLNPIRARINGVAQNSSAGGAIHWYTANSLYGQADFRMRLQADGRLALGKGPSGYANGAQLDIQADGGTLSQGLKCAIRLDDGNQGLGKVLTSDEEGRGTWQDAPAGGGGDDGDWVIDGYILTSGPGISQVNSAGGLGLEDDYEVTWNNTGGTTLSGRSWRLTTSVGGNIVATAFSDGRFILGQTDAVTNSSTIRLQVHGRGMAGAFGIGHGDGDPIAASLDVKGNVKISGGNPGVGKVLTSDADGLATWEDAGGGGGGGDCTSCADVEPVVFEAVCKLFVDEFSNVAQVTECVRVLAQLILVDANICEADCIGTIVGNVDALIQSKLP